MAVAEIWYDEKQQPRINIYSEFREKELCGQVPGARWDADERTWHIPLSWAGCVQLRHVFGRDLGVGVDLNTWAGQEKTSRVLPCLALREAEDAALPEQFAALYPFQRAGVAFMAAAGHALNADEMGLGKSVQTIATIQLIGAAALPALIVCPNSMKFTWKDEFERWAPELKPVVVAGTPKAKEKIFAALEAGEFNVAIINYEALYKHTRIEHYYSVVKLTDTDKEEKQLNKIPFQTVVADEAHRAKDPTAKQTRALWWMGKSAPYRYALTGTPVANSPEDVWTLMRFVSPLEYPFKGQFVERYANEQVDIFGFSRITGLKSETRDEFLQILDPRMIRRLVKVVLPQLPEKRYTTRTAEMTNPKQKKAYKQMREDMLAELNGGILMAGSPLVKMTRLLQFACAYGELVPRIDSFGQQALDAQGIPAFDLVLTEPSCTVDAASEVVSELGDSQAVIFAESRQLIEIAAKRLTKEGYPLGMVTGAVSDFDRAENVRRFQAGELKLLLLTFAAGGEGLTLTAANTAIFLQRTANAVLNAQAEGRILRIGQTADSVEYIDIVTVDTIQYKIHEILREKADQLQEIVRDEQTIRNWLAKS